MNLKLNPGADGRVGSSRRQEAPSVSASEVSCSLNTSTPSPHPSSPVGERVSEGRVRGTRCAFSLIVIIGLLAVIAILAAVLVPALIRQMDTAAGQQESAALKALVDALQQSILRKRSIPSHS